MSDRTDNTKRQTGKTLAMMEVGAQIQAIVPRTLGEVFGLAEMVHKAGLAPASVTSPQALTVIYLKAMELGLPPMASMEMIGVINGKAALHSDGIPALLWQHGFKIREWYTGEESLETLVAHCEITRPDGSQYTFAYSTKDAIENGLYDPKTRDERRLKSPWQRFTKRMTRMRCRGWLARDCASDVLKGMPIFEEQADIELARGEYREVKPAALVVPDDIPDSEDDSGDAPTEAEETQDAPLANPTLYLQRLEEQLQAADTEEVFDEICEGHDALVEAGRVDAQTQSAADDLREKYGQRLKT